LLDERTKSPTAFLFTFFSSSLLCSLAALDRVLSFSFNGVAFSPRLCPKQQQQQRRAQI